LRLPIFASPDICVPSQFLSECRRNAEGMPCKYTHMPPGAMVGTELSPGANVGAQVSGRKCRWT
jgi:hypothetical protein